MAGQQWSGQAHGWRYFAETLDGSGNSGTLLEGELPLTGVTVTDVLSGPPQITASIAPSFLRLLTTGTSGLRRPVLEEWGVAVYAEASGQIRAGTLLTGMTPSGPSLSLDLFGFSAYAKDMAYEGETCWIQADPIGLARHLWDHLQGGEDSNLGLLLDRSTVSDVRVGEPEEDVDFTTDGGEQVSFSTGPVKFNAWETDDIGGEIDALARDTPFEYRERHRWSPGLDRVDHFLDFGYPRIGARRDVRLVLGENIHRIPTAQFPGSGYASHVRVLGAGEGRTRVRQDVRVRTGKLRRMAVIDDPAASSGVKASARARREVTRRSSALASVTEFVVRDHPNTPVGSLHPGDEVLVQGEADWLDVETWVRILSVSISPESPDLMQVSCVRSDWLG